MQPVLVQIGPLVIRWYGVMIILACFVGLWIAKKEAHRNDINPKKIDDFFLYAFFGAIIGARLYYISFTDPTQFWQDPLNVIAVWNGGLAIHGAILGGLLIAVLYARKQKIPFLKLADTLTPSLILGQAIGRIGCFFNGDAHGYPTNLPWGIVYAPESPAGQMFPGQTLHPTQLYEMFLNLIIFGALWKLRKKIKTPGLLFLLYVILYSASRIFVEQFRADRLTYFGNISAAQSIGIIGIILGVTLIWFFRRKSYRPTEFRRS